MPPHIVAFESLGKANLAFSLSIHIAPSTVGVYVSWHSQVVADAPSYTI